jgi:hypothetical protein
MIRAQHLEVQWFFKVNWPSQLTSRQNGTVRPGFFIGAEGIMTDIGRMAHLAPARTQLAVDTYFDQARFEREQKSIFEKF